MIRLTTVTNADGVHYKYTTTGAPQTMSVALTGSGGAPSDTYTITVPQCFNEDILASLIHDAYPEDFTWLITYLGGTTFEAKGDDSQSMSAQGTFTLNYKSFTEVRS